MGRKIVIPYEVLVDLYTNQKLTKKDVATELGISIDTVTQNLKDFNIPRRKTAEWMSNPEINLSALEMEVMNGALLGDGCLWKGKAGNACFSYLSSVYNHVQCIWEYFKDYSTKKGIVRSTHFDKRTSKTYTRFSFRTQCNTALTDLRSKWYKDSKIVPKDLKLTPLTCLIWYIGDGHLSIRDYNIKLSTNSFSLSDIQDVLLPQLKDFEATSMKATNNQYVVYIPRRKVKNFLEYIGDCPFEEYKYKWDHVECTKPPVTSHSHLENDFIELYKQGLTYYAVAKHFNVKPSAVRHYLIKNNLYTIGGSNAKFIKSANEEL